MSGELNLTLRAAAERHYLSPAHHSRKYQRNFHAALTHYVQSQTVLQEVMEGRVQPAGFRRSGGENSPEPPRSPGLSLFVG